MIELDTVILDYYKELKEKFGCESESFIYDDGYNLVWGYQLGRDILKDMVLNAFEKIVPKGNIHDNGSITIPVDKTRFNGNFDGDLNTLHLIQDLKFNENNLTVEYIPDDEASVISDCYISLADRLGNSYSVCDENLNQNDITNIRITPMYILNFAQWFRPEIVNFNEILQILNNPDKKIGYLGKEALSGDKKDIFKGKYFISERTGNKLLAKTDGLHINPNISAGVELLVSNAQLIY